MVDARRLRALLDRVGAETTALRRVREVLRTRIVDLDRFRVAIARLASD